MLNRLIKALIVTFGVIVTAGVLMLYARDSSMIANWSRSGHIVTAFYPKQGADGGSFGKVDASDFAGTVPADGDSILSLADSTATASRWIRLIRLPHDPGREVPVTYLHGADTLTTVIQTRAVAPALRISVVLLQVVRLLTFLAFVSVGFYAFARRPNVTGVRALALFSFSMAGFMSFIQLPSYYHVLASFRVPLEVPVATAVAITANSFSAWWLILGFVFPRPRRFYQRHKGLAYALALGPIAVFTSVGLLLFRYWMPAWSVYAFLGVISAQVAVAQILIGRARRGASSFLERRQADLVYRGSLVTLIAVGFLALDWSGILPHVSRLPLAPRMAVSTIPYLFLLAAPVAFGVAFRRYRLMDVEVRLRRGTWYLAMNGLLLAVFVGVVYLVGVVLLDAVSVEGRAPAVLLAVLLAMGFAPARRRLQRQLETRLFPERRALRELARDFLLTAAVLPDRASLSHLLEQRLRDCLEVTVVIPALWLEPGTGAFRSVSGAIPVIPDGDLARNLFREDAPLFVDEALVSRKIVIYPAEREWLLRRQVALLVPLRREGSNYGFVAIGAKREREDFRPYEIATLERLSRQIAWTLHNLHLLEENIEKRRMEDELRLARTVQMRLFPSEIPEIDGLELVASSASCHEVAGDYYDLIPLEGGRALIVVADVSGKGAGAALLMANLQATLRAFSGLEDSLDALVARLNGAIHRNTGPEQFITLFAAVLDPRKQRITYVNAGHDPPLLLHRTGATEPLCQGGLVLGVLPRAAYEQASVPFRPGDLLTVYTDGLCDTRNDGGESFGVERLRAALPSLSALPLRETRDALLRELEEFRNGVPQDDDITFVLARATRSGVESPEGRVLQGWKDGVLSS